MPFRGTTTLIPVRSAGAQEGASGVISATAGRLSSESSASGVLNPTVARSATGSSGTFGSVTKMPRANWARSFAEESSTLYSGGLLLFIVFSSWRARAAIASSSSPGPSFWFWYSTLLGPIR